jgi:SAM-dependent methyltransferase
VSVRLKLDAPGYELAALREALRRFVDEAPGVFAALFAPVGPLAAVPVAAPEIAHLLLGFGLVDDAGGGRLRARMRIRRTRERFYVMSLGGVAEYRQDVWPETDAMLEVLEGAPPGRLLDMGTGTGIVAIEAAARGHRVVATDLYATALALARWNARLNGVAGIDFRQGHLFEPAAGERFDLVLTAPHYTRVADQLRLETLRAAPAFAAHGRVVIATFLEWEGDGPLAALELFPPPSGVDVTVRPLRAALKQQWFTVAEPDTPMLGLPSRHRFLVELRPGSGRLQIERPPSEQTVRQRYVSLSRLGGAAALGRRVALAVVDDRAALAALERLCAEVAEGVVTLAGEVPAGLLDACRWGATPCVTPAVTDGAAGAMLDLAGGIRPCVHGGVVARATDRMADVVRALGERAAAAAARRGCASCPAAPRCSRCLFPHLLSDDEYCARMRAWAPVLPYLHRALAMLPALADRPRPLRLKLRRAVPLVAAIGRPWPTPGDEPPLAGSWSQVGAIAVDAARGAALFAFAGGRSAARSVPPFVAEIAELLGDRATGPELRRYTRDRLMPPEALDAALAAIAELTSTT